MYTQRVYSRLQLANAREMSMCYCLLQAFSFLLSVFSSTLQIKEAAVGGSKEELWKK